MDSNFLYPPDSENSNGNALWTHWAMRLALGLWIALAAAVCVKSLVQGGEHSVYPIYVAGTERWWNDLPLHGQIEGLNEIYRYSPTFAILFTPFTWLPLRLGAGLWGILSVAATFCALRVAVRQLLPGQWPPRREGIFLALTAFGSMSGIWSGQINSLLLAMVIFAAAALKKERWWTAACLLTLPVFIKIWPIVMVMILAGFLPKRLAWRLAAVAAALALIPFLTRPFHTVIMQYEEWYVSLTGSQQGRWPGFRDAWTIWETIRPPVSHAGYIGLQLGSMLLFFLWSLYQRCRLGLTGRTLWVVLSMWVSWQLLFGPGSEQLTYGLIAPSAAWAMLAGFERREYGYLFAGWTTITWLCLTLLACGEIENPLIHVHPAAKMFLPLGVLSFAAWLAVNESGRFNEETTN